MKTRVLTSLVAIAILVPVLIFADYPVLPFAIAICSVIAVYEMLKCLSLHQSVAMGCPFYLIACGMPFLVRYLGIGRLQSAVLGATVLCLLYLFAVMIFSHGKYTPLQVGICFFSLFYILIGFNSIIFIHDFEQGGEYIYLVAFLGAWITDIFAYFCGMLFGRGGKHKLIPDVSPKKTVEGSVGGILFCVLSMILFGVIVDALEPGLDANLWIFALAGLAISIVAQIGDLSMSVLKRHYGIKDYGKLFPGHGGILDRFDSVLAVSTVLLVLCSFFNFF
ncbi:MAG: phosphatidate cytidylyltransferase [Clostridia bacterium]|nr:phosphatidate cytidylyltransferase [Clostridia bacterium]